MKTETKVVKIKKTYLTQKSLDHLIKCKNIEGWLPYEGVKLKWSWLRFNWYYAIKYIRVVPESIILKDEVTNPDKKKKYTFYINTIKGSTYEKTCFFDLNADPMEYQTVKLEFEEYVNKMEAIKLEYLFSYIEFNRLSDNFK